jgi:hypothetical protein
MSNEAITYLVGGSCAVFALAAYVAWILVPAWTSYSRWYQRLGAAFLSLYVLAALIGAGLFLGAFVVWNYERWVG